MSESLTELVKRRKDWSEKYDAEKKALSEKKKALDDLDKEIIALMEKAEIKNYKVDGVAQVIRTVRVSWNLPKSPEDRAAYFAFLKERGVFENLITVNSQTHSKFCKELLEGMAEEDPVAAAGFVIPGVPGKSAMEYLSVRKA